MEIERTVIDAAREGDTELLNRLLQEHPSLLDDHVGTPPEYSALHIAVKAGHVTFATELMKRMKQLAREFDRGGFRPLDVAAIMGNVEMVKAILSLDPELCLLRGKGQRTALHYAVCKGKLEVIAELVSTCPDCLKDVTFRQETALHLAMKSYQFEAFALLVQHLEVQNLQSIILNWHDSDGNTVLHLAASTKQHEYIELLLNNSSICSIVKVNAKNLKGLTAADILDINVMESPDDLRSRLLILQHAAVTEHLISPVSDQANNHDQYNSSNHHHHLQSQSSAPDWFNYFRYQNKRDSPNDTRNVLLVVTALIATVTYQTGITPPSWLFDNLKQPNNSELDHSGSSPTPAAAYSPSTVVSGLAAADSDDSSALAASLYHSCIFMFSNSLGLAASLTIILYLTEGFPFHKLLLISIYAVMTSYLLSKVGMLIQHEKETQQFVGFMPLSFLIPFLMPSLYLLDRVLAKKIRKRRLSTQENILPIDN